MFYGCTVLTGVTIPDGVNSIGYSTFCGCTGLTSIAIPERVTAIGDEAFSLSAAGHFSGADTLLWSMSILYYTVRKSFVKDLTFFFSIKTSPHFYAYLL